MGRAHSIHSTIFTNPSKVELCFAIKLSKENCAILFVERSNCQINYKSLHRTEQWMAPARFAVAIASNFNILFLSRGFPLTFASTHRVRFVCALCSKNQMNCFPIKFCTLRFHPMNRSHTFGWNEIIGLARMPFGDEVCVEPTRKKHPNNLTSSGT